VDSCGFACFIVGVLTVICGEVFFWVFFFASSILFSEALDPFVWGSTMVLVSVVLFLGSYLNRGRLARLHVLLAVAPYVLAVLSGLSLVQIPVTTIRFCG
jgi:hypothetical protein